MNIKKITIFIILFWMFIVGFFVFQNQLIIETGQEVSLKTRPVDPRDLLRGDYVVLNYEINTFDNKDRIPSNTEVYVTLVKNVDGTSSIKEVLTEKPKNEELFIKGKTGKYYRPRNIVYGIENYFVKEKTGRELERNLRKENSYVKVSVDKKGNARIKEIGY